MKVQVTLTLDLKHPEQVGRAELKRYIIEAVETWGGQYCPEDPLFYGFKKVTCGPVVICENRGTRAKSEEAAA